MYHKYKSLLQNMPTRHLLTKLEKSTPAIRRQIDRLVHVDIVNFFIAASPNEISHVLTEASDPEMKDGPYFSDEYAWYSMSMVSSIASEPASYYYISVPDCLISDSQNSLYIQEPGLPKCNQCRNNVSVIHLSPKFNAQEDKMSYLRSKGFFKTQRYPEMFYFDLTMTAIATVA